MWGVSRWLRTTWNVWIGRPATVTSSRSSVGASDYTSGPHRKAVYLVAQRTGGTARRLVVATLICFSATRRRSRGEHQIGPCCTMSGSETASTHQRPHSPPLVAWPPLRMMYGRHDLKTAGSANRTPRQVMNFAHHLPRGPAFYACITSGAANRRGTSRVLAVAGVLLSLTVASSFGG